MRHPLKYHQPILDLLGLTAVLPSRRLAVFENRERVCQVRFPASVREWFLLRDAETLFYENTNQDSLESLTELGNPAETAQGYLCIATENQAVVAWYVRLSEGDDPPVYDNNDQWNENLAETAWRQISVSFSNFIFDMISSYRFQGWYLGWHLTAAEPLPDATTLSAMRKWFQEGPTTDTPDSKVYRFFTPEGLIVIRSIAPEDRAVGMAEWSIETGSQEALLEFGRKVWSLGTLSRTLKAHSVSAESRANGNEILRRLRAENPT